MEDYEKESIKAARRRPKKLNGLANYRKWTEYKGRMKALGVTTVDLVPLFDEAPGTIGGRLNGYSPFPTEMRYDLDLFLQEREAMSRKKDHKEIVFAEYVAEVITKKIPATFWVPSETVEKLRDICYWDRESLADLASESLLREIFRREQLRGGQYPPRAEELKSGRPIR